MKRKTQLLICILVALLTLGLFCYFSYKYDFVDSQYKFQLGKQRYSAPKVKFAPRTKSAIRSANFLNMDSPIMINEIGIAGPDGYRDMLGRPVDWIELYNRSKRPISLEGYSLSDRFKKKQKWFLPAVTLQPNSTLVITADGRSDVFSKYILDTSSVRERSGWHTKTGFEDSFDGAVFTSEDISDNYIVFSDNAVTQMSCHIWVRIFNITNKIAKLSFKVNGSDAQSASINVHNGYQIIKINNPEKTDGSWDINRNVKIWCSLDSGSVFIDTVTLTDTSIRFGEGQQDLNSDLSLKRKGELVVLYGSAGQPVDYVSYPELEPGEAYTRIKDGHSKFEIGRSSMNESIIMKMPEILSDPVFTNETKVTISGDLEAVFFYTTDGSQPTTNSLIYSNPFSITNTTLLKVAAHKKGAISSAVSSKLLWKAPLPEMPVFWVSIDDYNLFSKTFGIIRNPGQRGRAVSERPCYIAILYPDGKFMDTYAGIRIQGRSSRWLRERKGYRVLCRREYGSKYWSEQIFHGEGPEKTASIILGGGKVLYQYIGYEAMRDADVNAPRIFPGLMFFNNYPMGFRYIKEDPNSIAYMEQIYGTKDLDVIKEKTANMLKHGTMKAWNDSWGELQQNDSEELTWKEINELVDPMEFVSWVSAMVYLSCGDNGQGYFVKYQDKNLPRWSFVAWDLDASLQGTFEEQGMQMVEGFRLALFRKARKNSQFSKLFKTRFIYLLQNKLDGEKYKSMLEDLQNSMQTYYKYDAQGSVVELGQNYIKTPELVEKEYDKMFEDSYYFLDVQTDQLLKTLKTP